VALEHPRECCLRDCLVSMSLEIAIVRDVYQYSNYLDCMLHVCSKRVYWWRCSCGTEADSSCNCAPPLLRFGGYHYALVVGQSLNLRRHLDGEPLTAYVRSDKVGVIVASYYYVW
jgi:hypothetical protein